VYFQSEVKGGLRAAFLLCDSAPHKKTAAEPKRKTAVLFMNVILRVAYLMRRTKH